MSNPNENRAALPVILVAEGTNPGYMWRQYHVITDGRCAIVEMLPALCPGGWNFHRVWMSGADDWPKMSPDQIVAWKTQHCSMRAAPDLGAFTAKLLAVAADGRLPERAP